MKLKGLFWCLLIAIVALVSCKKSGPAEAQIIVINAAGQRVANAIVVLRQDSVRNPVNNVQASVLQMGATDATGQATFTFKLEAVLNVEVSKDTLEGRDFIRLMQSEKVTKTVIIR